MPGEGSLHQIREAVHLQDVGQARAALQKPKTSQQKPQNRAMAGPCHLVQDDIPSRQCQSKCVSLRCTRRLLPPVRGGLPCALCPLASSVLVQGAQSRAYPRLSVSGAERIRAGGTVHNGRGIASRFIGGATAARSSTVAAASWPGTPGTGGRRSRDSLGRRLLARRARGSGTHLGAGLRRLTPAGSAWVQAPPAARH